MSKNANIQSNARLTVNRDCPIYTPLVEVTERGAYRFRG